jgi:hypothetical protein
VELSKKQAEFWAALIVLCIVTALVVMLVDFGIKAAILEESNALRLVIERERSGQSADTAAQNGANNNASNNGPIPANVLDNEPTGMEAGSASNGSATEPSTTQKRRTQSRRPTRNREVSSGDK